ncbi:2-amino-4-hydroxy-6-hydroxymethyldihydropteridine diphosphokinase [Rhodohalobacter sulfatireducens]|uniref:2-amino-4-hydroxy-6-hydroxymethyldihydropteridine pyrophosphokinase n=1 Tax=Rhodohalobacter sulfatireducens TaxID=2911366 RepID=A0ABS9KC92_9BACT|nr:2-amino-4-hydroxy-6-hydroxymethyldihydropteridine diphosphokinase [Rhodohalobacter sulfatireducens]MCG2588477.1 2-amino-4-hydroxy-6-hydroxymethyldihydropteridine diphosphokinase [Rhodohalobacter sulfatireducens]MDR9367227.1 2-amino-4-hydroxy-6-hydroxymethyldihydropteridine diphosphokinase [Balneolaceae bacterium]MDR9409927.1 2-amino-4-hydroxy-6-hydroxymethyldihydropteridine diphosphokinase [Balneolaceae bacterium]
MEPVIIAVGSNMGDRLSYIQKAGEFLESLSEGEITKSSIWESEPIGGAKYTFLNCAAKIFTSLEPKVLLKSVKDFEQTCGREKNPVRWGPRVIDLDLIAFGSLVIQDEGLIIPHPEFKNRLFVLLPLQEIDSDWNDPKEQQNIGTLVNKAPEMDLQKTNYDW